MLSATANALVDIYRGFSASSPYPAAGTTPGVAGVGGHLKHHMRHGRLGQGQYLKWTHVLLLPPEVDIRSAYHSQLNAWQPADADTVVLPDYPIPGWCTAFLVVLVQRAGRGTREEHLRAYLDRLKPRQGGCQVPAPGCCSDPLPETLHATVPAGSGCPCLEGEVVTLTFDAGTNQWAGDKTVCSGESFHVAFTCNGASCADATLSVTFENHGTAGLVGPDLGCTCSPLELVFSAIEFPTLGSECDGTIRIVVTE